jgi:hypothetical protein
MKREREAKILASVTTRMLGDIRVMHPDNPGLDCSFTGKTLLSFPSRTTSA